MKYIPSALCAVLLSGAALLAAPAAHAQINVNINSPSWGPAVPQGAQYYYIPETKGFYDVRSREYVVARNGQWYRTQNLQGYNPSSFHPVVVDYVGAQPWSRYDEYRNRYSRGGNPSNGGLPPGQAKKQYRDRDDDRNRDDDRGRGRNGGVYVPLPGVRLPDGRYSNDRRDERKYDSHHDRRDDGNDDDDHGKGHGKGHDKGKDRE
jgi:hypothetical protein